jgi:hypothetical protein
MNTDHDDAIEAVDEAQGSLYAMEHTGAWVLGLLAMVLAIVGTLTGLEIINWREAEVATGAGDASAAAGLPAFLSSDQFWDGAMLLSAGVVTAILAFSLHSNEHHRMRRLGTLDETESSAWTLEHTAAYFVGIGAAVYVIVGLLAGFGAFGDHDQGVGLTWIWFGVAAAIVSLSLHSVAHHQTARSGFVFRRTTITGINRPASSAR